MLGLRVRACDSHALPAAPALFCCVRVCLSVRLPVCLTSYLPPSNTSALCLAHTGNHDAEGSLSRRAILDLDMRSSNLSLTRQGPEGLAGASNYWIDVLDEQGQAAAARIWMLDSQSRGCGSVWRGW